MHTIAFVNTIQAKGELSHIPAFLHSIAKQAEEEAAGCAILDQKDDSNKTIRIRWRHGSVSF